MKTKNYPKKVVVIGLGYIGLPTAALIASQNINVIGVDVNRKIVDCVNNGNIHISEIGLENKVKSAVNVGNLTAKLKPVSADIFIITVPTPIISSSKGNLVPDMSFVESALESIAHLLTKNNLIILESTSPVGSTHKLSKMLAMKRPDLTFPHSHKDSSDIRIAYCPERVIPGKTMFELVQNDRIIGGITKKCSSQALKLYEKFVEGECLITDVKTAEMCKLVENSFRDVNIAFANELSIICDQLGIDCFKVISLANRHPRVNILQPGTGVGGHCIAIDPWFIVSSCPEKTRLIKCAREVNNAKPNWIIKKIKDSIFDYQKNIKNNSFENNTIICFGLSYKANIEDLRESPALEVVEKISKFHKGKLLVVEPNIKYLPKTLCSVAELTDLETALKIKGTAIILVNHDEFKKVKKQALKSYKKIIDTTGIWNN